MITVDIDALLKDMQNLELDVTRRLEKMVRGFMYEFSLSAIDNTPLGDAERFIKFYQQRQKMFGLAPIEGYARANWQVSQTGNISAQDVYFTDQAIQHIQSNLSTFKLGETITLGNAARYIGLLESNYSEQTLHEGITTPTINYVMQTYKIDLVKYYQSN